MLVDVIIPALNEEESIASVIEGIPRQLIRRIVVVDNGSTDRTAERAISAGADVVIEKTPGYGSAMRKGVETLFSSPPEAVVFMDGDGSDNPSEMESLISPIREGRIDLVIGSRMRGRRERGALRPAQLLGNRLACFLLKGLYGEETTDLGPFRVIRWDALMLLDMSDRAFGWTAEMQAKAGRARLRVLEVPVSYNRRLGKSKISGTLRGSYYAGRDILTTLWKLRRWSINDK